MTDVPLLRVVDVSSFQGNVDWEQVKAAGAAGGICKASEGTALVDPTFAHNWSELARLRMFRAAYHFGRPDLQTRPENEADFFLAHVGPLQTGDALILDLELGSGDLSEFALTWLRRVEAATSTRPWVYSFPFFIARHLGNAALASYDLWLAAYGVPECPTSCPPWTSVAVWQHSDSASWPGIEGAVDESVVARSLADLRALGKPPAAAPVPPHPAPPAPPHMRPKVVVLKDMLLRKDPHHDDVYNPAQLVYKGATLDVVGPEVGGWLLVEAGARRGYVLKSNTRPA